MRCPEAFEALSARFDGELRPTEIPLLQAHLATCAECQGRERELATVARRLRGAAVEQAPVPAALRARIARSITPRPPRRMPFVFGLAFLGAGVCLGALAMVARARTTTVAAPSELANAIRIEGEGGAPVAVAGDQTAGPTPGQRPGDGRERPGPGPDHELTQADRGDNLATRPAQAPQPDRIAQIDAAKPNRLPPGTTLTSGNRIEAGPRSIEVALGSWGHLSLAPGGRLQIERAPDQMTLLAGGATIEIALAPEPLRLHTGGGDIVIPEGRFEVQAGVPSAAESDRGAAIVVVQVLALEGHAQLISGGRQVAIAAGGRAWLRPDQPPLVQDHPADASAPPAVASTFPSLPALPTPAMPAGPATAPLPAVAAALPAIAMPAAPATVPAPTAATALTNGPPGANDLAATAMALNGGNGGLVGNGWPMGTGPNNCHLARGDSPVAIACSKGGVKEAKKVMKAIVKLTRNRGMKYDCDSCHRDEDNWNLNPNGRSLFAQVLEAIRT